MILSWDINILEIFLADIEFTAKESVVNQNKVIGNSNMKNNDQRSYTDIKKIQTKK